MRKQKGKEKDGDIPSQDNIMDMERERRRIQEKLLKDLKSQLEDDPLEISLERYVQEIQKDEKVSREEAIKMIISNQEDINFFSSPYYVISSD